MIVTGGELGNNLARAHESNATAPAGQRVVLLDEPGSGTRAIQ